MIERRGDKRGKKYGGERGEKVCLHKVIEKLWLSFQFPSLIVTYLTLNKERENYKEERERKKGKFISQLPVGVERTTKE